MGPGADVQNGVVMVLLQFLYNLSDREMEEQAAFNLVYSGSWA